MSRSFNCIDVEWSGDVCLARLRGGSLDDAWLDQVGEELLSLIEQDGCRKLVLLLGELDCLYSVLLGKLMTVSKTMQSLGGRVKLCEITPLVREVFRVCKVEPYFEFVDDRASAIRDW